MKAAASRGARAGWRRGIRLGWNVSHASGLSGNSPGGNSRSGHSLRNVVPRDRAAGFVTFVCAVVLAATTVLAVNVDDTRAVFEYEPLTFWLIASLAVLIDGLPFAAPGRRGDLSIFPSISFTFAVMLGWGVVPAIMVQSAAVLVSSVRLRHAPWRAIFNAAQYAVALTGSAAVLTLVGGPALAADLKISVDEVVAILGAAVVWFAINELLISTAVWLRFGGSWLREVADGLGDEALSTLGLLALGPLIIATGNFSPALIPLMLIPLFAVNELARHADEEQRKSLLDELTGLANRKGLFTQVRAEAHAFQQRISRVPGDARRMALMLLDIDQFRQVNDALGHVGGDRLLGAVAARLESAIGADGLVARLGGDEFAVFAPAARRPRGRRGARASGWPTRSPSRSPWTACRWTSPRRSAWPCTPTMAPTARPCCATPRSRCTTRRTGAPGIAIYAPESDQNTPERLELVADLRRALEVGPRRAAAALPAPGSTLLHGEVVGVEALLRWNHPQSRHRQPGAR